MIEKTELSEIDYSKRLGMSALRIAISYVEGYSSLKFLFEILEIQQNELDKYLTFPQFFNYLHGICYQSAVINLSNILVEDKQSVNIYYLRSFFENHIQDNRNLASYSYLYTIIQNITEVYSKKSVFYFGLKELRDKHIAHIDKIRFHSATGLENKISLEDINLAYDLIGNLVGKLIGMLGINPELVDFEQLDKAIFQFRLLINEMKENPFNWHL